MHEFNKSMYERLEIELSVDETRLKQAAERPAGGAHSPPGESAKHLRNGPLAGVAPPRRPRSRTATEGGGGQ
jgi:hypothetical protein